MNRMMLTRRICCMALFFAASGSEAANLAPHRAFYVLEAARLDDKGGFSAISGKLAYEITGNDCEGYAVSYRVANRYIQGEGTAQTMDVQLSSFESGDGLELDMRQKQYMNSALDTETRVKAKKSAANAVGEGTLEGGEPSTFELAADAIFPTAFQKQLMNDAAKGLNRSAALVFEGSDKQKATRAVSFIGAKKDHSNLTKEADADTVAALNKLPYWPVTVSYFDIEAKGDEQPTYQASFNMLDNGVSTDLVLDYGSYALKGRLEKIEMLKAETCK